MADRQRRLVVLGAGTGGTLAANRLRKKFPASELAIDVVDGDNDHVYQPGPTSCTTASTSISIRSPGSMSTPTGSNSATGPSSTTTCS